MNKEAKEAMKKAEGNLKARKLERYQGSVGDLHSEIADFEIQKKIAKKEYEEKVKRIEEAADEKQKELDELLKKTPERYWEESEVSCRRNMYNSVCWNLPYYQNSPLGINSWISFADSLSE